MSLTKEQEKRYDELVDLKTQSPEQKKELHDLYQLILEDKNVDTLIEIQSDLEYGKNIDPKGFEEYAKGEKLEQVNQELANREIKVGSNDLTQLTETLNGDKKPDSKDTGTTRPRAQRQKSTSSLKGMISK